MNSIVATQPNILFISHDRGESNNFKAVIPFLKKAHIDYNIIGYGQALNVFHSNKHLIKFKRGAAPTKIMLNKLVSNIQPKIVIAGMSSALQATILNLYKARYKNKIKTIAYYDNFEPLAEKDFIKAFIRRVKKRSLDIVFVPIKPLIAGAQHLFPYSEIVAKGSPAITLTQKCDKNCLTNTQLRNVLGYHDHNPVILFAGDASPDYVKYLKYFITTIKPLTSQYHFIITYHPKTSGELEKNLLHENKIHNVKVFNPSRQFSTFTLANIAQLVIVHVSSVGSLLSAQCKPIIYFAQKNYSNSFIEQGLAKKVSNSNELLTIINHYKKISHCKEKLKQLGLVRHSSLQTVRYLQNLIR